MKLRNLIYSCIGLFIILLSVTATYADSRIVHTVKKGESLMTISFKYYGTHQKWRKITQANPDVNPNDVEIGTQLIIPQEGDSKTTSNSPNVNPQLTDHKPVENNNSETHTKIKSNTKPNNPLTSKTKHQPKGEPKPALKNHIITNLKKEGPDNNKPRTTPEAIVQKPSIPVLEKKESHVIKKMLNKTSHKKQDLKTQDKKEVQKLKSENSFMEENQKSTLETFKSIQKNPPQVQIYNVPIFSTVIVPTYENSPSHFYSTKYNYYIDTSPKHGSALEQPKNISKSTLTKTIVSEKIEIKKEEPKITYINTQRSCQAYKEEISYLHKSYTKLKSEYNQQQIIIHQLHDKKYKDKPTLVQQKISAFVDTARNIANNFNHKPTCEFNITPDEQWKTTGLSKLIEDLKTTLGKDHVIVDKHNNMVSFQIPGDLVFGVSNPIVQYKYRPFLDKIFDQVSELGFYKMEIQGHSYGSTVLNRKRDRFNGHHFVLRQTLKIQDYLTKNIGLSPIRLSVSTLPVTIKNYKRGKVRKYFDFHIQMKKKIRVNRNIASINNGNTLKNLSQEILANLNEPKYSDVKVNKNGLEVHLNRGYLFSKAPRGLSQAGQNRLTTIMKIFNKTRYTHYRISWVPGLTEINRRRNINNGLRELDLIKYFLTEKLRIPDQKIQTSLLTRHHKLKRVYSDRDDKYNKRVIIQLISNDTITKPIARR